MTRSKKSKGCSQKRRSSLQEIVMVRERGGRYGKRIFKQQETTSAFSTQTGTYTPECSIDLLPLRLTLISLLGASGYVKLITGERSLPFSPEFTSSFYSELVSILRRGSNSSEEQQLSNGSQTDSYLMLRSLQKQRRTDRKSSKSRSSAK